MATPFFKTASEVQQEYDRIQQKMMEAKCSSGIFGATTTQYPSILKQFYDEPYGPQAKHNMLYHAAVEKAENGYILRVQHQANGPVLMYVAADTEELQRVFISAIVVERISK